MHGVLHHGSCGIGTPREVWEKDLSSDNPVIAACARHDRALQGQTTLSVLGKRFAADSQLVSDLKRAKPNSFMDRVTRSLGIAYYSVHNRLPLPYGTDASHEKGVEFVGSPVLPSLSKMARRYKSSSRKGSRRIKYKKSKKSKGLSKASVAKALTSLLCPKQIYKQESHVVFSPLSNVRSIIDIGTKGQVSLPNAFMAHTPMIAIIASMPAYGSVATSQYEYQFLKFKRLYEITNIGNSRMFVRFHIFTCTGDTDDTPMDLIYDQNVAPRNPNVATTNDFTQYTANYHYGSSFVLDPILCKDQLQFSRSNYRHKVTKEQFMLPGDQIKFSIKLKYPYKFNLDLGDAKSEFMKGVTKHVYLEVVGETSMGGVTSAAIVAGSHVSSSNGVIDYSYLDTVELAPKPVNLAQIVLNPLAAAPALQVVGFEAQEAQSLVAMQS